LVVIRTSKYTAPKYFLLLAIPLSLSAFTHLWNPIGFPYFVGDEGHYIRRSLQILEQFDPQETARYDHPYFGQLFLAGLFKLIGYPASLNPVSGDVNSTQMLYMVPRIIMGLLAVLDTFLIYKICELLYTRNKAIAFIGSILFAVMPLTWLTRRVYLDSIQLPLILLSILLAIYFYNNSKTRDNSVKGSAWRLGEFINKGTLPIILSGIALGLAIFTKIPALTMIPVIAYLIFRANKKYRERIKNLGLWLIPVILIPAIWPAYAISVGEYDNWYNGVFSQAGREGSGIGSIGILFKIDPVLVSIGIIGLVFATVIKKDLFLLIWIIPFLIFHTIIPWTQHFHWIQVLPVFCIAAAVLIDDTTNRLVKMTGGRYGFKEYPSREHVVPTSGRSRIFSSNSFFNIRSKYIKFSERFGSVSLQVIIPTAVIVIFGLVCTSLLISTNVNSSLFELVTFLDQILPHYNEKTSALTGSSTYTLSSIDTSSPNKSKDKITMVGNHWIFGTFWVPKYVYGKDHDFKGFFTKGSVDTDNVVIVADRRLLDAVSSESPEKHIKELQTLYNNANTIAEFKERRTDYNEGIYPYQSMSENRGIGRVEIKTINHILTLSNLNITEAKGSITSLQNDNSNLTWITGGQWKLYPTNPGHNVRNNSNALEFNATVHMVRPDNKDRHSHNISNFILADGSIHSNDKSSTLILNGTAMINTEDGSFSDTPISIIIRSNGSISSSINKNSNIIYPKWIPEGGTIEVWIDPERVNSHFGNTPIYGNVKKSDLLD